MTIQKTFNYQKEIEQIKTQFNFDFVALALVQSTNQLFELKWTYATGNHSNRFRRIVLRTGKGVAGNVLKTGKPMLVEDMAPSLMKNDLHNYLLIVGEGLKSVGAIPLYKSNRVHGILLVACREGRKLTATQFTQLKQAIGPEFGPFYNKEMFRL
ncbi:GAF domain-containing protein [Filibacter tadaridae]|uniref:GAF domain-containing protein n=1 Tax=Filibacter tadaridae TaxID=2483811 RepID=A0A3P5WRC8_9BACL|nr:GAF domain-containing protein [Filibacter tadaridae]VDC23672.1 hypothetical protein FILTAD_00912 [Filibacter tadaridae]